MKEYRILLIEFPIIGSKNYKLRPVLMLNKNQNEFNHFQGAYITSNNNYTEYNDLVIESADQDFKLTKLSKTSTIRFSKINTFEPSLVKGELGVVPEIYISKIKKILKQQFNI